MAIYSDLNKLGRVKLPSNTVYALIDVDGRAIIAPNFSTSGTYGVGDHVIYGDNLYRCKSAISSAGAWDSTKWDQVTVDGEIKRLESIIAGGIHYRGKTTTALYDGATTNPITIGGASYTAESGDLVILGLSSVAVTYATSTAYSAHTYIKNTVSSVTSYYITNSAITAGENTSFDAIVSKLDKVSSDPEFLFDGTTWSVLGSISDGLGDLAFKDSAAGTYVKPTGSGTVTIRTYGTNTQKLTTTTITGTNGTVSATNITSVATGTFATAGTAVVYGTADVGSALSVGTALSGATTFNTNAISSATLTGTKTFNTDAIKAATLGGTTTFNTDAIKTSVEGDCLTFTAAATASVTISTTPASTGTVGISTTAASTGTVTLTTSSITPAKAADTTRKLTPVGGTGTVVEGIYFDIVNPASVAASATTVATGGLETGTQLVTGLTSSTESATVNVGTTTDTIVVK